MAKYRKRSSGRASARRNYSRRGRSSYSRRAPSRRPGAQTVRLVIQTMPSGGSVAVPGVVGATFNPPTNPRAKF